ncbi:hypothetical protein VY88_33045 [Azospirillum thiophilum]|uniref:Uncharacterized protein n=1 Tax=Azospirillum thiophilum TaxID=528244 RepID=A0AAC8W6F3_9PROT|nr:hypothetical protein [Azospirillum thiophilum]ALG75711.1 hypothetical protein AL072_32730 [Azospirillum thiophilum]KJR61227.1 hypothetical protein VY88_33045 [Azospirillum thiophilum]
MILIQMALVPFGDVIAGEHPLVTGAISSAVGNDGQPAHAYRITVLNAAGPGHVVSGTVSKTASGHRNPLHLLAAVAADVDLQVLGSNYAATMLDLPADDPRRLMDRRLKTNDRADTAIAAIRSLAAAGEDGRAALERIEAALVVARAGAAGQREAEGLLTDPDIIDAIADGLPVPGTPGIDYEIRRFVDDDGAVVSVAGGGSFLAERGRYADPAAKREQILSDHDRGLKRR